MHYLCPSTALDEGQSCAFSVAGKSLLGVRRAGTVYLYRNRCPHRGIALNWSGEALPDSGNGLIECVHHGAQFLVESGECITGPCAGQWLEALGCHEDSQGLWFSD